MKASYNVYNVVNQRARRRLHISVIDYCVADSIYHLSNNPKSRRPGWCYITQSSLAYLFGISKRTLIEIQKRLVDRGLLEVKGHVRRTTALWYDNVILDDDMIYGNNSFSELSCRYCAISILDTPLHVDHYVSKQNGGEDKKENYVLACIACNVAKGSMNGDEFTEFLSKSEEISLLQEDIKSEDSALSKSEDSAPYYNNSSDNINKEKTAFFSLEEKDQESPMKEVIGEKPEWDGKPATKPPSKNLLDYAPPAMRARIEATRARKSKAYAIR